MVTSALVITGIADAKRLIEALDAHNIRTIAVLWSHKIEEQDWRLVIATSLVDQRGSRSAYTDIQGILKSLRPAPTITLQDISVISPKEQLVKYLRTHYGNMESLSSPRLLTISPNTGYSDSAYVYRVRKS